MEPAIGLVQNLINGREGMREVIGLALSTMLFQLSNRMGTVIKLTGRGWRQPYRAYYRLVDASQRARTWARSSAGNSERGEQLRQGLTREKRATFGPYHERIIIPMIGRGAGPASNGRGANLFLDSENQAGHGSGNKLPVSDRLKRGSDQAL
jgi:hypothetical protein